MEGMVLPSPPFFRPRHFFPFGFGRTGDGQRDRLSSVNRVAAPAGFRRPHTHHQTIGIVVCPHTCAYVHISAAPHDVRTCLCKRSLRNGSGRFSGCSGNSSLDSSLRRGCSYGKYNFLFEGNTCTSCDPIATIQLQIITKYRQKYLISLFINCK